VFFRFVKSEFLIQINSCHTSKCGRVYLTALLKKVSLVVLKLASFLNKYRGAKVLQLVKPFSLSVAGFAFDKSVWTNCRHLSSFNSFAIFRWTAECLAFINLLNLAK
jgi:hypothetical protein